MSTENPPYPADAEPPYLRLDGPNQWLPDDVLPAFHGLVDEFFARLGAVADVLMEVLSAGLQPAHDPIVRGSADRVARRVESLKQALEVLDSEPADAAVTHHEFS